MIRRFTIVVVVIIIIIAAVATVATTATAATTTAPGAAATTATATATTTAVAVVALLFGEGARHELTDDVVGVAERLQAVEDGAGLDAGEFAAKHGEGLVGVDHQVFEVGARRIGEAGERVDEGEESDEILVVEDVVVVTTSDAGVDRALDGVDAVAIAVLGEKIVGDLVRFVA